MPATIRRIRENLINLADHADQLISLTEWYKKILLENGIAPEKITVIPQRLAIDQAMPVKRKSAVTTLPIKIVFIGRVQPQKGVDLLIEAAKSLPAEKLVVDIYGIEEDTEYYRQCRAAVAGSNIRLMGPLERGQVLTTLAQYDMLCLPSTFSEMSPLVIQEAFAADIPVLASRVLGNAEQVKHGINGLLFTFKSVDDLRIQLNRVIDEPALIDKMKSRINPPGTFSETAMQYGELIKTFHPE
jgi:glycosyltransferase involved in cell wall biosynthesis